MAMEVRQVLVINYLDKVCPSERLQP